MKTLKELFFKDWKRVLALLVLLFVLFQLIPVSKTNPAVVAEPAWDSPQTRALAQAACFDCHSNETVWPWYAKIAPSSWLLAHDVDEGRSKLNFSEWGSSGLEADEIAEMIDSGEMPPFYYVWMHSDAKLSDTEKQQLIDGLQASMSGMAEDTGEATGEDTGAAGDSDSDDD